MRKLAYIARMRLLLIASLLVFAVPAAGAPVGRAPTPEQRCVHVCSNHCVSESAAERSKFNCSNQTKTDCFATHGHCVFVKGKGCGWRHDDDLSRCMQAND